MSLKVDTKCNTSMPVHVSVLNIKEHPWHYHKDTLEIIYVLKGEINNKLSIYDSHLSAGDISVINPYVIHYISSEDDNITLIFDLDIGYFESNYFNSDHTMFVCNSGINKSHAKKYFDVLRKHLADMYYDYLNHSPQTEDSLISNAVLCLSVLRNHFREWQIRNNEVIDSNPYKSRPVQLNRLTNIIRYLYTNYKRKISLDDVAGSEYISKYHVSRIISQGLGMSFQTYLNLIRVEYAQEYLYGTDLSIDAISDECGFSSPGFFRKCYKLYTGLTPLADRKNEKERTVDITPMQDTDLSASLSKERLYSLMGLHDRQFSERTMTGSDMYVRFAAFDISKSRATDVNARKVCAHLTSASHLFSYNTIVAVQKLYQYECCGAIAVDRDTLKDAFDYFNSWSFLSPLMKTLKETKTKMIIFTSRGSDENDDELYQRLSAYSQKQEYDGLRLCEPSDGQRCDCSPLHYIKQSLTQPGSVNILPLFSDGTSAPALFSGSGSKRPWFYAFSVLNRLGDEILERSQDHIVTRDRDSVKILACNVSENDDEPLQKSFTFKLTGLKRNYLCCSYNLNIHSGDEAAIAEYLNVSDAPDLKIADLIEKKAFPEFEVYGIENTPEYNLFTAVPAGSVTFIEVI